jgi:NAD(P)-dependent dehydrogenase (short-subunit alcohol dehydrogenase family)
MVMYKLDGKVVLVTGSSSGLGRVLAGALVRKGARVVIHGRSREKLLETKEELEIHGNKVVSVQGDVRILEDCRKMIGTCIQEYGKLDVLINNAGIGSNGLLSDTIPEASKKVLETNLLGSISPTYYALPHVVESRGSIVFVSSLAGIYGLPFKGPYCASKMALTSLVQTLRIELEGKGVHLGIMYVGILENDARKKIINHQNRLVPPTELPEIRSMSPEKASMEIIRSIEKRKSIKVFTGLGKFFYLSSRISPLFVRKVLTFNMKKVERSCMPT